MLSCSWLSQLILKLAVSDPRSCVKVGEVGVLGYPSLIVHVLSVDVKQRH